MIDQNAFVLAQKGDEQAFKEILEYYTPMVAGYFTGKAPQSNIEDLAQEVFLSAFQNIRALRSYENLGPWLLGIARHKLHDFYQRDERDRKIKNNLNAGAANDPRPAHARLAAQQKIQAHQINDALRQALGELKEKYRVILYLRLYEEQSYVEIARQLGLRGGTVRIRARRGLAQLRKKLIRQGIGPEKFGEIPK